MNRKPMDEKTKKKISEALTKNKSAKPAPVVKTRSDEMKSLENDFNKSQKNIDLLKNSAKTLKTTLVKPPKKATKAQKEKYKKDKEELKKKIEDIKSKIKAEKEKQKRIKDEARGVKIREKAAKDIERANLKIQKIAANQNKLDGLEVKVKTLLSKAKTSAQKQRVQDALQRIAENRKKQSENHININNFIKEKQAIVANKKIVQKSNKGFFKFSEICLKESTLTFWRELKEIEMKTDFKFLNDSFDELEMDFQNDSEQAINEDIERGLALMFGKLKAGDIPAIAAMSFIGFYKLNKIITEYIREAFEIGKKTASEEIVVERPTTPTKNTQINNFTAGKITDDFINNTNSSVKESVKLGIANGVAAAAIIATAKQILSKKKTEFIKRSAGLIINDSINEGRKLVFEKNITKIQGYLRSEILDSKTCPICRQLDGIMIKPNDAMAQLGQVHTNCRGVWVPILENEQADGEWGVPKKIRNSFEVDNRFGIPRTNNFKQLEK